MMDLKPKACGSLNINVRLWFYKDDISVITEGANSKTTFHTDNDGKIGVY